MKALYTLLFVLILTFHIKAASYTWNGSVNGTWSNATNWTPNGIPSSTDDVTIVSSGSIPSISTNTIVRNFTITSGSLLLNGNSLTINGIALLTAGTIDNGSLTISGSSTTFGNNGLSGPTINTTLTVNSGTIILSGGTFNGVTNLTKTGATGDYGKGGNTFNATTTIKITGSGFIVTGDISSDVKDIFNRDLTLIYAGTGPYGIYLCRGSLNNEFNGNITITTLVNCNEAVTIGGYAGTSKLASGKTIIIEEGNFPFGGLTLSGITQNDDQPAPITLNMTGNSILKIGPYNNTFNVSTVFNGPIDFKAGEIELNGAIFNNIAKFTKIGASSSNSRGGNTFNGNTTITNKGTGGYVLLANSIKDIYNGNLTITNSGASIIYLAHNSANNEFNGNITVNSTGTGGIWFGHPSTPGTSKLATGKTISIDTTTGFSSGTLLMCRFSQLGSEPVTLNMTGSSVLRLGPSSVFNGAVDFTAGGIELGGTTYNNTAKFTKTAASGEVGQGGNIFNGATTIINTATGGLLLTGASATTGKDIFNGNLTITNSGASIIYLAHNSANNEFNGNITVNSTGTGGIWFGHPSTPGTSKLATGKTISIDTTTGFSSGMLYMSGFKQFGDTPQTLIITGNSQLSLGQGNIFEGMVIFTAPQLYVTRNTFLKEATFTKTGIGANVWGGGNTFKKKVHIINQAPANSPIHLAQGSDDIIN